jgi:hypothetical protein
VHAWEHTGSTIRPHVHVVVLFQNICSAFPGSRPLPADIAWVHAWRTSGGGAGAPLQRVHQQCGHDRRAQCRAFHLQGARCCWRETPILYPWGDMTQSELVGAVAVLELQLASLLILSHPSALQMALNTFADLTAEEFAATHLGMNPARPGTLRERAAGAPANPINVARVFIAQLRRASKSCCYAMGNTPWA